MLRFFVTVVQVVEENKAREQCLLEKKKEMNTHGAFAMTKELSPEQFKHFHRLSREEFEEIHQLIKPLIFSEGCNAQKSVGTEEKLTVFKVSFILFNVIFKHNALKKLTYFT